MVYICRGHCAQGRTPDGSTLHVRRAFGGSGLPPIGPITVPRGEWGGWGRCAICNIVMWWEGLRCPCCSCLLRRRRRFASLAKRRREAAQREALAAVRLVGGAK